MARLSESEFGGLAGVCAALTGDEAGSGEIAAGVARAIEQAATPAEQLAFRRALRFLDNPLVNALLAQTPKRLSAMSMRERERLLQAWAGSRIGMLRKGFQTFKRLALFHEYALISEGASANPNWEAIGYPGLPDHGALPIETAEPIQPLSIAHDGELANGLAGKEFDRGEVELRADVVVVGSGAGGAVVAAELAAAGAEVFVLEKGKQRIEADFDGAEYAGMRDMYEKRGILTSDDVGIVVLAGSTLGGGTTINWTTSLSTPAYVLEQWERELGVSGAAGPEWQDSLQAVSERLLVNTASQENRHNALLRQACETLGYSWRVLPRNVHGCGDCGYCGYGCRSGAKQSALNTYLADACHSGAQIVTDCTVERVTIEQGRATGVTARLNGRKLRVRSRLVIVAAGSVHTPALLLRSGLVNPNIGRHLHLHPVPAAFGVFDQPVEAWRGTMQCVALDQFMDLDNGYGFAVEVPPAHPGLIALGVPWHNAEGHRGLMRQAAHMAFFFALVRDRDGGRVTVDSGGQPVINYQLSAYDRRHVEAGAVEIVRLLAAAGAHTIGGPANSLDLYRAGQPGSLDVHLESIRRRGYVPNDMTLFSAHQMSSCRMAGSPQMGVVSPAGESFEVKDLFVADASALPTATGVNPMISIMALSHRVAQAIKARV
jgi:choline dehydrogenase-like flavoprotein